MRLRSIAALSLFSLLALGGNCRLDLGPTRAATFLLAPDQTARVDDLRVQFVEVISDSRCPANATCVTAGDAVVSFELRKGTANVAVDLQVVDPVKRATVFEGYIVELTALGPYPVANQPLLHDDYRAAIEIRRQ